MSTASGSSGTGRISSSVRRVSRTRRRPAARRRGPERRDGAAVLMAQIPRTAGVLRRDEVGAVGLNSGSDIEAIRFARLAWGASGGLLHHGHRAHHVALADLLGDVAAEVT